MSNLKIYRNGDPGQCEDMGGDVVRIGEILKADLGITFEHWDTNDAVNGSNNEAEIKAAYADHINRINGIWKFNTIDIIAMKPDHPDRTALRAKFLDEHTHSEDEVRFFVEGSGLFYVHGDNGSVYQVLCEKQDLISIPANTRHWFDMGPNPHFSAIRFFHNPEGWVAHYSGDKIADGFPRMEA